MKDYLLLIARMKRYWILSHPYRGRITRGKEKHIRNAFHIIANLSAFTGAIREPLYVRSLAAACLMISGSYE